MTSMRLVIDGKRRDLILEAAREEAKRILETQELRPSTKLLVDVVVEKAIDKMGELFA